MLVDVVFSGLSALSVEGVEEVGDAVACPVCGTLLGREVPAGADRPPVAGVE
ncbi:hypothetical protein [Amycolatopsis azurea]|nr:hypothetical protein [Amycolatopsis azurea]